MELSERARASALPPVAPEATRAIHPGAVWRRRWPMVVVAVPAIFVMLMLLVGVLPVAFTATARVEALGTEVDPLFGATGGRSVDDEVDALLLELGDEGVLLAAARDAGVDPEDVDLVVTSPRETRYVDVAVTLDDRDAAIAIADAIPALVAASRSQELAAESARVSEELRAMAAAALDEAATLQDEIDRLAAQDETTQLFIEQQRRHALVTKYTQAELQADQVERGAALRPLGFSLHTSASQQVRARPPEGPILVALAALVALVAGMAIAMGRELLGNHVHAENLDDHGTGRHLGRIRHVRGELDASDVEAVAARFLTMPNMSDRRQLVSVVSVGADPHVVSTTVAGLAAWLCIGGVDAAVMDVDFDSDESSDLEPVSDHPGAAAEARITATAGMRPSPAVGGTYESIRIRRAGGTALGAAYSNMALGRIAGFRRTHDVLFVDSSHSGPTWWAETTLAPDLVVAVLAGGSTRHDQWERARIRLSELFLPAVTIVVEPTRWAFMAGVRDRVLTIIAAARRGWGRRRGLRLLPEHEEAPNEYLADISERVAPRQSHVE